MGKRKQWSKSRAHKTSLPQKVEKIQSEVAYEGEISLGKGYSRLKEVRTTRINSNRESSMDRKDVFLL